MFITDKIVYLQLAKTGCTHTGKILYELAEGKGKIIRKHNTYEEFPESTFGDFRNKLKVGNIRNPWDWYVSTWAFGCQKNGGLYKRLTGKPNWHTKKGLKRIFKEKTRQIYPQPDYRECERLYADPNNTENFKTWLKIILSAGKYGLGDGYKESPISSFAGLLTYKYTLLYTYEGTDQVKVIGSPDELESHFRRNYFMDIILRNENLHSDILTNVERMGFSKTKFTEVIDKFGERTNASSRNRNYRYYYDTESIELVERKESMIIHKYGYRFE